MIIAIITFFSFLIEYFINFKFGGTIFTGLILFSSLIFLEPYFQNKKRKFFLFCFLIGFLYDFIYTGTYFMNAGFFLLFGVIINYFNHITPNNLFVLIFELICFIVFYRFLSFIFLFINGVVIFDFNILFRSIYSSIFSNVYFGYCLLIF